jgi:hypothetical protein
MISSLIDNKQDKDYVCVYIRQNSFFFALQIKYFVFLQKIAIRRREKKTDLYLQYNRLHKYDKENERKRF